jgi:dienelactone hydrolase
VSRRPSTLLLLSASAVPLVVAAAHAEPPSARVLPAAASPTASAAAARQAWQRQRAVIRAGAEAVMGPFPQPESPLPLDVQEVERRTAGAVLYRKVSYCTDGPAPRVTAWLLTPEPPATGPAAAILCLHQTVAIGKDEPAGLGGNPHLHYARELAERGYVALAPDYPSFGEYAYAFDDARYASGTMKAIYDNVRAVDLLQSLPEVDPQRIGAIGHSLGGHNAIFTAFFDERVRAIVSCCGFTRFHRYYGGDLAGWTSTRYMPRIAARYGNDPDQMPCDFPGLIAGLSPRPFLAVAPVRDDNFAVEGVRETMAAAAEVYALDGAEDRLQADYPDAAHDFPDASRQRAYQFFDKHLHHTPRSGHE